jgi:hypothetical protein
LDLGVKDDVVVVVDAVFLGDVGIWIWLFYAMVQVMNNEFGFCKWCVVLVLFQPPPLGGGHGIWVLGEVVVVDAVIDWFSVILIL